MLAAEHIDNVRGLIKAIAASGKKGGKKRGKRGRR